MFNMTEYDHSKNLFMKQFFFAIISHLKSVEHFNGKFFYIIFTILVLIINR